MRGKSKYIDLNENFRVTESFRALRKLCRDRNITLVRNADFYSFKLDTVLGLQNMNVDVHTLFGRIIWLELHRDWFEYGEGGIDIFDSYNEINYVLLRSLGHPIKEAGSLEEQNKHCVWSIDGVEVSHYLFERFVLVEHLRIELVKIK